MRALVHWNQESHGSGNSCSESSTERPDLFYELIKPYERAVFLAAVSIVGNDADAEEVAQEAALKGFKYLSQFRQEAKFSTWLIQITINEARMKLRKDRRHLYESLDSTRENDEGEYMPD